jgi:hypothetical protein
MLGSLKIVLNDYHLKSLSDTIYRIKIRFLDMHSSKNTSLFLHFLIILVLNQELIKQPLKSLVISSENMPGSIIEKK